MKKSQWNLSNRGVLYLFLIFYTFLLLKRYFLIKQSTSTFLNVIKVCFPGLHMGISTVQWRIAWVFILSVKRFFLRRKLVFGSYFFLSCFFIRLIFCPVGKKTSTRCLEDVFSRQARHLAKTFYRCPKDVLNANLKDIFVRYLEESFARYIVDVLHKTS